MTRVVAIGGGHGLATTLTALRRWDGTEITGIVSVADDGGSSGRLRRERGIIAPGDIRRCVEALATDRALAEASAHRFRGGELDGHAAGNLWLAALLERHRDPVVAVDVFARGLGAVGRILPATVEAVDLVADTEAGPVVGQVAVSACGSRIHRLATRPDDPRVAPAALDAVATADLVVVGPGSLYTSVLAALVPRLREAVADCDARVVYVANAGPQPGETDGYDLVDHIGALVAHGVTPDLVLADSALDGSGRDVADEMPGMTVVHAAMTGGTDRHDPVRLAAALRAAASAVSA
ncbi:MAG: YvcK family protein [Actinomyces sp.]|nr:MAG: YvcK family protein [Actinomyces sp.]